MIKQEIYDRFSFLEGLVSEDTYRRIVETAVQIQSAAAMPAAPSDAVPDALADIRAAVAFLDQVRSAHDNGDDVNGTGAAKDARQWLERAARTALSQTMQPQAEPVAGEQAGAVAYQGPKKFTAEEVADGNLGIRWVTAEAVMGRPSSHDVMEYLKRNTGAMCNCEQCRAFFPALAAPGAAIAAREQDAIDRAAWAKLAAKAHGWTDDSTPPMVDGRFETGWHESEFQTFMQGVRHGRS